MIPIREGLCSIRFLYVFHPHFIRVNDTTVIRERNVYFAYMHQSTFNHSYMNHTGITEVLLSQAKIKNTAEKKVPCDRSANGHTRLQYSVCHYTHKIVTQKLCK